MSTVPAKKCPQRPSMSDGAPLKALFNTSMRPATRKKRRAPKYHYKSNTSKFQFKNFTLTTNSYYYSFHNKTVILKPHLLSKKSTNKFKRKLLFFVFWIKWIGQCVVVMCGEWELNPPHITTTRQLFLCVWTYLHSFLRRCDRCHDRIYCCYTYLVVSILKAHLNK